MARWDAILSLPVQNPPTLEFSAAELVWSKIEGWRDNIDRLALIPFARVGDFVRGESANKDCPSRFHVEARRRRPPKTSFKQKVDGILEYILYWCSFGPDDHRKGGIVRPSRNTYVPKKKNAGRPNTKRGCTCHFIVKRLIAEPSVALVIYNQDKHVDKKGLPCHGPQDKKAEGTRAMFAPYISEDLRLRVLSLLYVGVSVETIMQRHGESVERQGGPSNRDDLLTHRYVRRQERSIRRSTYELDTDDAVSISLWVESHQSHVFFYEDYSDSNPFVLGIQTEWQLQQMIRFGNHSLIASDSRFGTNKLKYPVHSLVVFNSEKKAIPVAWIITPGFATADIHRWMRALYNRVRTKDPSWRLAGFIVDDPSTDIFTIRDVFQCSVLVSFWRVRHAWHKNLVKRCSDTEMRVQMLRRLGEVVDGICRGQGNVDQFEVFMEDYVDSSDFMDYFKAVWYPRLGVWTTTLKTLPLASQETCAAMELYHNQLKVRLLNEKDSGVYQRADWLVDKLGTKVHSYFWLDEYSEKDDFARYWKDEWAGDLTAWRKGIEIPDLDVVMEGRCAKVTDQLDQDKVHVVWNPGSDFAICDCEWAEMGNLCEHVFKVIRMSCNKGNRKPSISLFQFNQALIEMLHCPPHDSLFRDHAVSLAIAVQKQLDELVDLDSSHFTVDFVHKQTSDNFEQRTCEADLDYHNRESMKGTRSIAVDFGESIREETAFTEMEIDPSSSCIPLPAESVSVSPTAVNVVIMENGLRARNDRLTDRVGLINDHVEDMEPLFVDIQPLHGESIKKATGNQNDEHKNGSESNTSDADMLIEKTVELEKVNVLETSDYEMAVAESGNNSSVNANTADADMLSDKTVELQTVSVLATSGTTNNDMAVVNSGNGSKSEIHYSTNRVHDEEMRNSDCENENHDSTKAVHPDKQTLGSDAIDVVMKESKSLVNCSSMSNQQDYQLPRTESRAHETCSPVEASLSDGKWSLTRCTLEKAGVSSGSSHLDVVNGSVAVGIAESSKASESDKDAAVRS